MSSLIKSPLFILSLLVLIILIVLVVSSCIKENYGQGPMVVVDGQLKFPPGTSECCDININRYFQPEEYKCKEFNDCIKYCNKYFPNLTYCQLTCPNEFDCPYPKTKMLLGNDLNNFPVINNYEYLTERLHY